ncbi:hypothetical protein SF83666_c05030 [Sinorhizobium fredii CCBAU 83666]|nr:hypothetical protein SF83666_c05030 [Sinorhizobium fredii CCBAU 83666]
MWQKLTARMTEKAVFSGLMLPAVTEDIGVPSARLASEPFVHL